MNQPTSDVQFLARMLLLTRSGDQITEAEANRLRVIAEKGYSSTADEVADSTIVRNASPVEEAVARGATRVPGGDQV